MNKAYIIAMVAIILLGAGYFFFVQDRAIEEEPSDNANTQEPPDNNGDNNTVIPPAEQTMNAIIKTNYGEIVLEFFAEDAPKTVENFTTLAKEGFYDGTKFHRVIPGFMIQGGDPFSKDNALKDRWGTGGPGYAFEDEIHVNNRNNTGTIAMANAGPDTNGSQFFINVADNNFLDTKHTVFGKVKSGMDVVQAIENVSTEGPDRPVKDAIIESITITEPNE